MVGHSAHGSEAAVVERECDRLARDGDDTPSGLFQLLDAAEIDPLL